MKNWLIGIYVSLAILAYGHFWNYTELNMSPGDKFTVGLGVSLFHPLYWSTLIFEKEE